jgi:hypothetical protein
MGAHRELAISAMKAVTRQSKEKPDFMEKAQLALPGVTIPGSLPQTLRTEVVANDLHLAADLVLNWTIGDYPGNKDYSAYYDPASPWYNVFFGAYGIRSYKLDGQAWGYHKDGRPDFDEFLEVVRIDYNNFVAGQFGCPAEKMSFEVLHKKEKRVDGWDIAKIDAFIPSGLHDPVWSLGQPGSYVVYGVPSTKLMKDHPAYEKLEMHGQMYMRRVPKHCIHKDIPQPITFAFGALCRDDKPGRKLLDETMTALKNAYLQLYPEQ